MSRQLLWLSLFLPLIGCSNLHTGRSFLSEMSHDDSRFFHPRDDFPIVAGDSGEDWISERERKDRTPSSESDLMEERRHAVLRAELRELEGNQAEEDLSYYEKNKHMLPTISEKIYFLKLPYQDRRFYLQARGLAFEPKAPARTRRNPAALSHHEILMGMTKNDVLGSWGKPLKVEVAGNPSNENERWLYEMNGASKYIYFESGQVHGWE